MFKALLAQWHRTTPRFDSPISSSAGNSRSAKKSNGPLYKRAVLLCYFS
jgi:hypothetical protein